MVKEFEWTARLLLAGGCGSVKTVERRLERLEDRLAPQGRKRFLIVVTDAAQRLAVDSGSCVQILREAGHLDTTGLSCCVDLGYTPGVTSRVSYRPRTPVENWDWDLRSLDLPDRTLYFDVDGVLLDYDEKPKTALDGGVLESELKRCCFEKLVCVSGWSEMVHADALRIPEPERCGWIHRLVAPLFPDIQWFLCRLSLLRDTDHRAFHINLASDWYYVDDWADHFFPAAHGVGLYGEELGRRICVADPFSDGSDILEWLKRIFV